MPEDAGEINGIVNICQSNVSPAMVELSLVDGVFTAANGKSRIYEAPPFSVGAVSHAVRHDFETWEIKGISEWPQPAGNSSLFLASQHTRKHVVYMYIEKHKTVGRAPSFLTGSSVFQANLVSYGANYLLLHIRYIQIQCNQNSVSFSRVVGFGTIKAQRFTTTWRL